MMGHYTQKSQQKPVRRTIAQLRKLLLEDHEQLKTWREVAKKWKLPPGSLCRIAETNYEPRDPHLRHTLGLPTLIPAPVCTIHGVVHTMKRCPRMRQYRDLFDVPTAVLREMLEQRVDI